MSYQRPCKCPHRFPVCACNGGLTGAALVRRSRTLSSYAGWPAPRIDAATAARVMETHARPTPPTPAAPARDCGCGGPPTRPETAR